MIIHNIYVEYESYVMYLPTIMQSIRLPRNDDGMFIHVPISISISNLKKS